MAGNIFEQFARFCPKLKQFNVWDCHCTIDDLFKQYYPGLEHLKYSKRPLENIAPIDELKSFLEKHSKLKQVALDSRFLWDYGLLNRTNIQLHLLKVDCFLNSSTTEMFDNRFEVVHFLQTLFERGFYKILRINFLSSIKGDNIELFSKAISTLPQLEILSVSAKQLFDLSNLTDLKVLNIARIPRTTNIETLAKIVPKLQRLVWFEAGFNEILPFVRHSKKLKTIEIMCLSNDVVFDLVALNEERKKLENACRILVFLRDHYYLPLK